LESWGASPLLEKAMKEAEKQSHEAMVQWGMVG
jgi:hypothetical protein